MQFCLLPEDRSYKKDNIKTIEVEIINETTLLKLKNDVIEADIYNKLSKDQGWGQVQLTKYSSTSSIRNIYQVQVLVKYSFFYKST